MANKTDNMLAGFTKIKNKFVNYVCLGKDINNIVNSLSEQRKVYAKELLAGVSVESIAKKYSKGKALNQTQAHATMAKFALGGKQSKHSEKSYAEGYGKSEVRHEFLDAIKISDRDFGVKGGLILTLSSHEFLMENQIAKMFRNFQFLACEMDAAVIFKMFNTVVSENIKFVNQIFAGKIMEVIETAKPSTFAHINLDFCRSLLTFGNDVETTIKRDIVKVGGCIMITVSARARGLETKTELEKLVKKAGGNKYKIIYAYEKIKAGKKVSCYNDGGGNMHSAIIRRIS